MQAMLFEKSGLPLKMVQRDEPEPGPGELLLRVNACGVCRTDLHIIDSELSKPKLPLIIGHEIVGTVLQVGRDTKGSPSAKEWAYHGSAELADTASFAHPAERIYAITQSSPATTLMAAMRRIQWLTLSFASRCRMGCLMKI